MVGRPSGRVVRLRSLPSWGPAPNVAGGLSGSGDETDTTVSQLRRKLTENVRRRGLSLRALS